MKIAKPIDDVTRKTYLGHGCWVEMDHLTGGIKLTTSDGVRITNTIFMDPQVLAGLYEYLETFKDNQTLQAYE